MKFIVVALALALLLIGCEEVVEVEEAANAPAAVAETPAAFVTFSPAPSPAPTAQPSVTASQADATGPVTSASEKSNGQDAKQEANRSEPASVATPSTARPAAAPAQPAPATARPSVTPIQRSTPAPNCDPSYPDVCLPLGAADYDCEGGGGNGPNFVRGPIRVLRPDPHQLDRDGDGYGCEPRPPQ